MKRFLIYALFFCLFAFFFVKAIYKIGFTVLPDNQFAAEAAAFLDGRLDIGYYVHDVSVYEGKNYFAFPPFPALLLTPFIFLFGSDFASTLLIAILITVLSFYLLNSTLKKLGLEQLARLYLLLAFFMGTAYWFEFNSSAESWHFSHIVAVAALFLAVHEALGRGSALFTGLYLAMAFLTRQMTVYAALFLITALFVNDNNKTASKLALLLKFALFPLIGGAFYLWFNWARFGDPFDTGYSHMVLGGFFEERIKEHGLFSIAYLPFNFIYLFLQGFHVNFKGDDFLTISCLDPYGTSLTFASPFVFIAFFAKWKKPLLIAAWASIALMVVHSLFYYSNGFYQINAMRFTLDFMPILILLVALGTKECKEFVWKGLILYSVLLNIVAFGICFFSR